MNWGASITGVGSALDTLGDVRMRWGGETLYLAGPQVEYAVYQERGTSDIEARPFMAPAARRVGADPSSYAQRVASGQGLTINSQGDYIRAVALAVQNEAKRIADAKGVRDTGALIASITIEEVR